MTLARLRGKQPNGRRVAGCGICAGCTAIAQASWTCPPDHFQDVTTRWTTIWTRQKRAYSSWAVPPEQRRRSKVHGAGQHSIPCTLTEGLGKTSAVVYSYRHAGQTQRSQIEAEPKARMPHSKLLPLQAPELCATGHALIAVMALSQVRSRPQAEWLSDAAWSS